MRWTIFGWLMGYGLLASLSACGSASAIRKMSQELLPLLDCEKSCEDSCEAAKKYLAERAK